MYAKIQVLRYRYLGQNWVINIFEYHICIFLVSTLKLQVSFACHVQHDKFSMVTTPPASTPTNN